jgi:ABC-type sugar transport system ATPase subunit
MIKGDYGSLLRTEGLTKRFEGLVAVDRVNLEVNKGEVLALVGENAAGKSTLIKMLSGIYPITAGKIYWKGEDITDKLNGNRGFAKRLGIEAVYQGGSVIETMNVYENVFTGQELTKRVLGIPILDRKRMKKEAKKFIEEYIGVEIDDYEKEVRNLSGGQRQAVAIARAIYGKGIELLIMDEPTANLDADGVARVLNIIKTLRKKGMGIIFIEHNIEHVLEVADSVMIMRHGRIVDCNKASCYTKEEIIRKMIA